MQTYYEAVEDTELECSAKRAKREVSDHGCDWSEFVAECGDLEVYRVRDLLLWLGY